MRKRVIALFEDLIGRAAALAALLALIFAIVLLASVPVAAVTGLWLLVLWLFQQVM